MGSHYVTCPFELIEGNWLASGKRGCQLLTVGPDRQRNLQSIILGCKQPHAPAEGPTSPQGPGLAFMFPFGEQASMKIAGKV